MTFKSAGLLYLLFIVIGGPSIVLGSAYLLAFYPIVMAWIGAILVAVGYTFLYQWLGDYLQKRYLSDDDHIEAATTGQH